MPYMTLAGFIAHLATFEARLKTEQHAALDRAAKLVQDEAKRELGTYQEADGPFAAWPELADATKDDRVKKGFTENDPGLRSGETRDSIGRHVGEAEAVIGSDSDKLVWFELGTEKQPPRSVLGLATVHKEAEIVHELGQAVKTALIGKTVAGGLMPIKDDPK